MMRNPNHDPHLHIYSKVCRMGRSKYTTIPAELARDDDVSVHDRFEWLKTATGYELIVIPPGTPAREGTPCPG
jgi:hypothetical protein